MRGIARPFQPAAVPRRPRRQPAVWRPAPTRDRALSRHQAPPAPARRARCGHEPGREKRAHPPHPADPETIRAFDPARGALDAGRDGRLPAHRRARLRRENRGGPARRHPERPQGHRGLPRRGPPEGSVTPLNAGRALTIYE